MSVKHKSPALRSRLIASGFCWMLFCLTQQSVYSQPSMVADQLQSLRPNFWLAQSINERGLEATAEVCVRPCDQIWLVSSRFIPDCTRDPSRLSAIQLQESCWVDSSVEVVKSEHDENETLSSFVYVHGNMTDLNWSIARGLQVYKNLIGSYEQVPAIRFIIWSWPSERQTIPIRDVLKKSRRAVQEGVTLRSFLDHLEGDRPVLLGYSFGAQVIMSALQSSDECTTRDPYTVSVIAPAFDRDYIHCEIDSCKVQSSTARLQAFVNENDRVIRANNHLCRKKYRRSCICDHLISSKLNGCESFLDEIDITSGGQCKHSVILYSQQPAVVACIQDQLITSVKSKDPSLNSGTLQAPQSVAPSVIEPSAKAVQ